ncbi:prephenate dehydratase [Facilibium subflavum]|uniref:prephenate dehydratase n=1 Tax=Facilibium subflavum TaxID=2219058 RepID=UPI000E657192|nr:prephenate dehydratase [Facilibium subflavum]
MSLHIAFQGEHGAYSEQAIQRYFINEKINTQPCSSFEHALSYVSEHKSDLVMLPVENSVAGSVISAYDALLKYNLCIHQEIVLKVQHCLLANKGVKLEDICEVRSHEQALSQCQKSIQQLSLVPKRFSDTAGAAKYIAEKKVNNEGAIASELAAKTYGLDILRYHFEDESFNYTRFFLLGRQALELAFDPEKRYKTSIVFATLDKPNALVQVLSCLSDNGINMTKIESRPSRSRAWECIFFVDFEGHDSEEHIQTALLMILKRTSFLKNLGCYQSTYV